MEKIDKRKVYGIMLDTETANTIVEEDGKLEMGYVLPYDFGFKVIDSKGNSYENHSYVNSDIFLDEFKLMQSAYYCDKIPDYIRDLVDGTRQLKTSYEIRKIFCDLIKKYDCQFVVAHNARFDYRACNNIQRWTTKSKYRYFFPKDIEIWDTLKMARDVLLKMPTYIQFCEENGFMTKHRTPQPQLTAEVIYRFITNDIDFVEEHKGFEDVEIETEIFKYLVRQHKPMRKKLFEN
jgi:DNA polymerase III epsilon subunit-like protein